MRFLVLICSLAGCAKDTRTPVPPDGSSEHTYLPSDGHWVAIPYGYTSVQACLAAEPSPWTCTEALTLCANGQAGYIRGDLAARGTYAMTDSIAAIALDGYDLHGFDVEAVAVVGSSQPWVVDSDELWKTQGFYTISCDQP